MRLRAAGWELVNSSDMGGSIWAVRSGGFRGTSARALHIGPIRTSGKPAQRPARGGGAGRKRGLEQVAAGRRLPVQHFARGERAGPASSMKCSSSSANETPPAVEIARSSGATPVSRTGTAPIRAVSAVASSDARRCPADAAASCSNPIAGGDRFAALRRNVASDCLPRGALRRRCNSGAERSGRRLM